MNNKIIFRSASLSFKAHWKSPSKNKKPKLFIVNGLSRLLAWLLVFSLCQNIFYSSNSNLLELLKNLIRFFSEIGYL